MAIETDNLPLDLDAEVDDNTIEYSGNPKKLKIKPNLQKGEILTSNGTILTKLAAGALNQILASDNSQPTGLKWINSAQIKAGSYAGNGASTRIIEVGFQPDFVLIIRNTSPYIQIYIPSFDSTHYYYFDSAGTYRNDEGTAAVTSTGFQVFIGSGSGQNTSGITYGYLALKNTL